MISVRQIISGGQTGADMAGLLAAKELGLATGGWMPRGFLNELGHQPWMRGEFGMKEHDSPQYPPRTRDNIRDADGTAIFSPLPLGRGSKLTWTTCVIYKRPKIIISNTDVDSNNVSEFIDWLEKEKIVILNVAGCRESKWKGWEQMVKAYLLLALRPQK